MGGDLIASGDEAGEVKVWNVKDSSVVTSLHRLPGKAEAICFNNTGTHLAVGCNSLTRIYVWEIKPNHILCREAGRFLSTYQFCGKYFQRWNLEEFKQFGFPDWVNYEKSSAITSDNRYLARAEKDVVRVWRVRSIEEPLKKPMVELGGHLGCKGMLIKGAQGLDDRTFGHILSRGANKDYNGSTQDWLHINKVDSQSIDQLRLLYERGVELDGDQLTALRIQLRSRYKKDFESEWAKMDRMRRQFLYYPDG